MHVSITPDRIMEALQDAEIMLDNPGFCIHCGAESAGCEPDAREYLCDECGRNTVYGAEELLIALV